MVGDVPYRTVLSLASLVDHSMKAVLSVVLAIVGQEVNSSDNVS